MSAQEDSADELALGFREGEATVHVTERSLALLGMDDPRRRMVGEISVWDYVTTPCPAFAPLAGSPAAATKSESIASGSTAVPDLSGPARAWAESHPADPAAFGPFLTLQGVPERKARQVTVNFFEKLQTAGLLYPNSTLGYDQAGDVIDPALARRPEWNSVDAYQWAVFAARTESIIQPEHVIHVVPSHGNLHGFTSFGTSHVQWYLAGWEHDQVKRVKMTCSFLSRDHWRHKVMRGQDLALPSRGPVIAGFRGRTKRSSATSANFLDELKSASALGVFQSGGRFLLQECAAGASGGAIYSRDFNCSGGEVQMERCAAGKHGGTLHSDQLVLSGGAVSVGNSSAAEHG
ncbi:unnamed protein product, partial [Symbiodinium microadriaticum]